MKINRMPTKKISSARRGSALLNIKHILVPSDFSPASGKALDYASHFARLCHSEVTLLHVLESSNGLLPKSDSALARSAEASEKNAKENLRALVRASRSRGVPEAKPLLRTGVPTHEIVEAAKELDVDLIVIATHGFTGWRYFTIGSTAERVARAAPCPVLVVREKEHEFI
jgi:nucleotide-binding universal stress UspA family protein